MAKSRNKSKTDSRPELAVLICSLRRELGLNQVAFGEKFGCSPMAVFRWERGVVEQPSPSYIELGNLAGDPLCWYFWGRAGLNKEDVLRVLAVLQKWLRQAQMPHLEIVQAGISGKQDETKGQSKLVAIPLLRAVAVSHGERGDGQGLLQDAPVEGLIAAAQDWCTNPTTTSCLRVRGASMPALIYDGNILVVDSSQNDVSKLDGKIVIAWHKNKGLTVSRLKIYEHTVVLQPENSAYQSLTLSGKHHWKIIAKLLWWIGKAP